MIAFLSGKVAETTPDGLVIETDGIGYQVLTTSSTLAQNSRVGQEVRLWTYLQVREDGISLFGFGSREEKTMFEQLITVSGVGCKGAIAILSGISASELALCIATGDARRLTGVKGIGKKTAERILLELREKVRNLGPVGSAVPEGPGGYAGGDELSDAVSALIALGIPRGEAKLWVDRAVSEGARGLEEIISAALKRMY